MNTTNGLKSFRSGSTIRSLSTYFFDSKINKSAKGHQILNSTNTIYFSLLKNDFTDFLEISN